MSARELGAEINTRTKCESGERSSSGWHVRVTAAGGSRIISARAIVNAAGPWVKEVLHDRLHQRSADVENRFVLRQMPDPVKLAAEIMTQMIRGGRFAGD